jgi:hypothetical protein
VTTEPGASPDAEPEPTASTAPTRAPIPADLPEEIRKAIAWRLDFGLRADPEWVIAVHADPSAIDAWDDPILQAEEDFIWARNQKLMGFAASVRWYAGMHPDVFGGLYFDNANNQVMSLWTEDPEGHLAGILERAGADAPIATRQVRWTEAELRDAQRLVSRDDDWYGALEAEGEGWGVDTSENVVTIEISSANPDAPRLIAERLARRHDLPVEMFRVESDGTGIKLLPFGRVVGVVVTADGDEPGRNDLWMDGEPEHVGYCPNEPFPNQVARDGTFEMSCTVGVWRIQATLWDQRHESSAVVGESSHLVEVREGETVRVRVRLDPGAQVR